MSEIILSAPVRSNLLSLQNTADLLAKTQERLSTGLKVNSALDDPSAFFTAAGLNNRAGDLNRLLDSVGLAVQTIEAADSGISAITDLVEAAQATARQALQSPGPVTNSVAATTTGTVDLGVDVAATQTGSVNLGTDVAANVVGAASSVDLTSAAATFTATGVLDVNGQTLAITGGVTTVGDLTTFLGTLSGAVGVTGSISGGEIDLTADNNTTTITAALTGAGAATLATELGIATSTTQGPTNATVDALTGTATIQVGTNTALTLDFSTITTRGALETALGGLAGGTATVNGGGNVVVTATANTDSIVFGGAADTGLGLPDDGTVGPTNATIGALTGTATLTIGSNATLTLDFDTGISNRAELETALGTLVGGTATIGAGNVLTVTATDSADSIVTGGAADTGLGLGDDATTAPTPGTTVNNVTRTALEAEFNNLRTQIDQLAADASFNGNNLLQSDDLTVIFNEDGTSSLTISGVDFDSAGLGIAAAATASFQTDANIDATLTELDTAIATLRTQASTFGSNLSAVEVRQDFTKDLINVLETGAGGLTLADTNEEGANLLSLQTRQQLSTTSLSLATQAEQNVLRLF